MGSASPSYRLPFEGAAVWNRFDDVPKQTENRVLHSAGCQGRHSIPWKSSE